MATQTDWHIADRTAANDALDALSLVFVETAPGDLGRERYIAMITEGNWDVTGLQAAVERYIRIPGVWSFPKPGELRASYLALGGVEMSAEEIELDAIRREWLALPYGGGSVWVRWAVQIVLWAWYSALLDTAFAVVRVEQAHISDLPRERFEATRRQLETSGVLRRAS